MTTELRTIQIEAYRDPNGWPVCAIAGACCKFLSRCEDRCLFNMEFISGKASIGGNDYLRPVEGCPVWGGE